MSARPVLTGYRFSVFTRAARIALAEKGVGFDYVEHDPFAGGAVGPHPFGRVPVLRHGDFEIYETAAIIGYVDDGFDGPGLMPEGARAVARQAALRRLLSPPDISWRDFAWDVGSTLSFGGGLHMNLFLSSIGKRRIWWRDTEYEMISASETRIVGRR